MCVRVRNRFRRAHGCVHGGDYARARGRDYSQIRVHGQIPTRYDDARVHYARVRVCNFHRGRDGARFRFPTVPRASVRGRNFRREHVRVFRELCAFLPRGLACADGYSFLRERGRVRLRWQECSMRVLKGKVPKISEDVFYS